MSHYVIIDGQLQRSSPETRNWARRSYKAVPSDTEEKPDSVSLPKDTRTDYEIIESLDETEED